MKKLEPASKLSVKIVFGPPLALMQCYCKGAAAERREQTHKLDQHSSSNVILGGTGRVEGNGRLILSVDGGCRKFLRK